tara:strand:+ start:406 stop:948 length:543 start_codon:yes stop_codon:yes gene_type:complete
MYKDLFLGVREYDCNISEENLSNIISIASNSDYDKNFPGFQSIFSDLNEPLLEVVKKSFLQCCQDYFKLKNVKEDSRLWFYQDWKSNPHRDGQYWHDHPVTFYGLSGIMYLTLPDNSSTTGFSVNADKQSLGSYFEVKNMIYLPRKTKKWFIFPNWYPHFPGSCETENRRITVGADYWVI